jgi:polyisoprenyl-phosphate glycosyltransferase
MNQSVTVYSVVIPVYKSERILEDLYARLVKVFDSIIKEPYEILFIDDASPDGSWLKLQELHRKDARVKIIRLSKNFGQHCALMCGFNYVSGEYIITMDDDLQHPPEEIPKLINAINNKPDIEVVIGKYEKKEHSWWRNIGSYLNRVIMIKIFSLDKSYRGSSFRIFRSNTVKAMIQQTTYQPRIGRILKMVTDKYDFVTVEHQPRKHGKSGYSIWRLSKDLINNVLNNSTVILRATSILGFSSACLSFVLVLYYLLKYFTVGIAVPGFTTIIIINLFFSGIMLFSLGVVGEYLMKILFETRKYPQYVVQYKKL